MIQQQVYTYRGDLLFQWRGPYSRHDIRVVTIILRADHWRKLADERLEAANRYLVRAREAEAHCHLFTKAVNDAWS